MLSVRPRRRDITRCSGRSGSRASALHASAYHSARLSAQVLLRLARAPAVVADADAAASRLFDEFPSLCGEPNRSSSAARLNRGSKVRADHSSKGGQRRGSGPAGSRVPPEDE